MGCGGFPLNDRHIATRRAFSLSSTSPQASVIVCSLNGEKVLPACLESLRGQREAEYEVILVDNGSTDATPSLILGDDPRFRLIQTGRNLGFGGGNNAGMQAARGAILILLNDDTVCPPDWLARTVAPFERNAKIGAVGCKLVYPDRRTIQHAGGRIHANASTSHIGYGEEDKGQYDGGYACDYVTGAALALRRAALEQVGLLDPAFWPIYYEEVDLQKRLADAGWGIWYEGATWLVHYESQSQGLASPRFVYRYTRNRLRYLTLHGAPGGWRAALRLELASLRGLARDGHGWTLTKAYASGLWHWPGWLLDRRSRRTVERLTK